MDPTVLVFPAAALIGGWLAGAARLPPMIGFVVAGFVLHGFGWTGTEPLSLVADLGVTLLLFTIGLKFDIRTLLDTAVWGTTVAHMAGSAGIALAFLVPLAWFGAPVVAGSGLASLALVAFALSFSSTVLVMKLLQERSQTQSFYGRVAVGILILQDLAAVVFLTLTHETGPTWWALLLVLLIPAARPLRWAWGRIGHGEMQVLFGIVVALVPGYALFSAVGLKGDLGALVMGLLLASHPKATELSRALFSVKELLLVAFFLDLGLRSSLSPLAIGLGAGLLLMLPLQAGLYLIMLRWTGLRTRTAARTSLALMNYSEFGLIVAVVGADSGLLDAQWLAILSVTVCLSFLVSVVVTGRRGAIVAWAVAHLPDPPHARLHPEDRPIDTGEAEAVVLGMGRIGRSAYDGLTQDYALTTLGVDADAHRVEALRAEDRRVVQGDATDGDFWNRLSNTHVVRLAVLAMPFHGANLDALRRLQGSDFEGTVAVVAQYDDEREEAYRRGADVVLQLYDGAGAALADDAALAAGIPRPNDPSH
ncbi:MAG: cation:proton antiporter [Arachnia sp.]